MPEEKENLVDEIMCDCTGTTRGKIQSLFEQGFSLDEISSKTGVSTGCSGCEWDIESLLEDLQAKK